MDEVCPSLYTAVLGLHFEREQQKKEGQLAIFNAKVYAHFLNDVYDIRLYPVSTDKQTTENQRFENPQIRSQEEALH